MIPVDLINKDKADDPFKIMELTKHVCKTTWRRSRLRVHPSSDFRWTAPTTSANGRQTFLTWARMTLSNMGRSRSVYEFTPATGGLWSILTVHPDDLWSILTISLVHPDEEIFANCCTRCPAPVLVLLHMLSKIHHTGFYIRCGEGNKKSCNEKILHR
jgi:hypothetical protein